MSRYHSPKLFYSNRPVDFDIYHKCEIRISYLIPGKGSVFHNDYTYVLQAS